MSHYDCDYCGASMSSYPNCCDLARTESQRHKQWDASRKDADRLLYDRHQAEVFTHTRYFYYLKHYVRKML